MKKSCLHNTKCNQYQWLLDKITIWTSLKFNSNQMPMIQIWISLKLNRSRKYSKQEHELSFMDDILTRVRSNYLNADPQKFTQWVDDLMDLERFSHTTLKLTVMASITSHTQHSALHSEFCSINFTVQITHIYKFVSSLSLPWNISFVQSNSCLYTQMFLKETTISLLQNNNTFKIESRTLAVLKPSSVLLGKYQ